MWHERAAALLMVAIGLLASLWMHSEAVRATVIARVREQQLEHLQALSQPAGHRSVDERALSSLGGLFPGQTVVWLHTSAGPTLSLVEATAPGSL